MAPERLALLGDHDDESVEREERPIGAYEGANLVFNGSVQAILTALE